MEPSYIPPSVYQFRVVLQAISPLIWRRLLIRSDMCLATLHAALQIVFAWSDEHLHAFRIHGKDYDCTRLGGPHFEDDPRHVPLGQLHLHRGERFTYVYNFIDYWVCDLRLEAVLPLDSGCRYPICLGGKHAAPPEDGGGAWAYLQRVDRHRVPLNAMATLATVLELLLKADDQTTIRQLIGTRRPFGTPSISSTPISNSGPNTSIVVTSMRSSVRWCSRKGHDHEVHSSRDDHHR